MHNSWVSKGIYGCDRSTVEESTNLGARRPGIQDTVQSELISISGHWSLYLYKGNNDPGLDRAVVRTGEMSDIQVFYKL